ncbi:MAG: hypothetical protein SOI44_06560 [Lactimicrobium sp.]|jgi:outer membrane murein-binding lipoprotein Lpp|uniref:hypothetical protein n=1 Tax=Lactimicrobium sp. TaxID=2563780 RepID=UPI002F35D22F
MKRNMKATSALLAVVLCGGLVFAGCGSSSSTAAASASAAASSQEADYQKGVEQMSEEKYANAAEYFRSAGDYSDAADQCLEAEYQYVASQRSLTTSRGKQYMQDLLDKNYKDAKDLAAKLGYEASSSSSAN